VPRAHLAITCLAAVLLLTAASIGDAPAAGGRAREARGHRHERRREMPSHQEQLRFMWAMAGQESGWDYFARNRVSGAYGKYQIMPMNWPSWAEVYLGDRHADQTPYNQEKVAYGRLRDLYRSLRSWDRVAYWWLTGSNERRRKRWSGYAAGYVERIAALRRRAPRDGSPMPRRTSSRVERGDWRVVDGQQVLRRKASGLQWTSRGGIPSGLIVQVRATQAVPTGMIWLRVVTADGRLGWLRQATTMPARTPDAAGRWHDVTERGRRRRDGRHDRDHVRPRPR
jgi:hypothetical protein